MKKSVLSGRASRCCTQKSMKYEVWEKLAHRYNRLWVQKYSLRPTRREVLKIVLPLLEKKDSARILEIGCGTGQLIQEISRKYNNVRYLGIDVAENMIKIARVSNTAPNVKFMLCPIERFKPEDKYDIVICTHAFPYFPDKAGALRKIAGLCAGNARIVMVQSSTNNLKDLIINFFLKATTSRAEYPSIKEMLRLFAEAGLKVKRIGVIRERRYMPTIALFYLGVQHHPSGIQLCAEKQRNINER